MGNKMYDLQMVELKALTMVKMQNKKSEAEFYELLIQS